MLQEQSVAVAPVAKPMLEEMIFVFTHSQNEQFKTYVKTNPDITKVVYLNMGREFNYQKKAAFNELMDRFRTEISVAPAKLITFAMDFNIGYSGYNISPVNEIIAALETEYELAFFKFLTLSEEDKWEPTSNYVFAKTPQTLADAKNAGNIPFRFVLTGSGGQSAVEKYHGFEDINPTEACEKYSFQGWPLIKFLAAMRKANGGTPLPLSSPQSTPRRLGISPALTEQKLTQRNSSTSSTATNVSSPSLNNYEFSPSSRTSSFSTIVPSIQESASARLTLPANLGRASSETTVTAENLTSSPDNSATAFSTIYSLSLATRKLNFFEEGNSPVTTEQTVAITANDSPPRKRPSPIKTHEGSGAEAKTVPSSFKTLKF
ncbi:MAG: hypothetical protein V4501_01295 [Pseudomonadota bacterium]